jgi:hypoxanthine phosphoribosyltransferase
VTEPTIEVLFSAEVIAERNRHMAEEIRAAGYTDRLVIVAVLKGGFVFAADLVRALHAVGVTAEIDFMSLSSYRAGTTSTGTVTVRRDIDTDIAGRDVLILDDILESGRTLAYAKQLLFDRGAARVALAVVLDKPGHRIAPIEAEFVGFTCPDLFVVGYGMDMAHAYRELPYIGHVIVSK